MAKLKTTFGVCQEVIANLLAKPDENLQRLVCTQLCEQLTVILNFISQDSDCNMFDLFRAEVRSVISAFYEFHNTYFLDLGTGLVPPVVQSLLLTLNVTAMLSEKYEEVQAYLVADSHLVQNLFELEEMKKTLSGDSVASNFIALNLMILYSCSVQSGFHRYFRKLDPVLFWGPYCRSPQFVIRYHSMVIAGRISTRLPSFDTAILQLEDSDVEIIANFLSEASASDQHEVKGYQCIFSTAELLSGINSLLSDSVNAKKLIKSNFLSTLISILVAGYPDEQKQVILILWNLANHVSLLEAVAALDLPLMDILHELEFSEETHLNLASSGLLSCIDSSSNPNPEACYTYHHYGKCIEQCDTLLSTENKFGPSMDAVELFKGKSLYKLFRCQQSGLDESILDEKNLRMKLNKIYSIAKEAILIFDKAILDAESSQMFDIAMIEYASATNRLREIQRCLLCRSKSKLLRCHISCPHSILREFFSGLTAPENRRVFDTSNAETGHSKSPKEVTMFAFCKSCEKILSIHGEQDFITKFFRKIYSKSDLMVQSEGVSIHYESWLYHFCIGMLFRTLIVQKIDRYNNCQEIYDFFLQCRNILLTPSLQNSDFPDVHILIGPHKARDEDREYGFVNQVLNSASINLLWGSDKPPYSAHFLLVHIGIIYIVKHFSSSTYDDLPPECKIDPNGGIFLVPPEESRYKHFTEKWWGIVRVLALKESKRWLERPLAPLVRMKETMMISPTPFLDNLFHVSSSVHADLEVFQGSIVPSPDSNKPRIVSLLPPGFGFRPSYDPANIILPKEHQILLHHSVNDKECYFIAVGNSGSYDFANPYVIYSHCEPGLQVSLGFFIDPNTLKFVNFLPLREGKVMLERLAVVDQLKAEVNITITKCLKAKGIKCLTHVLHLLELDLTKLSVDTKCFGTYCWYCVNKCCFCLSPSGSNFSSITSGGIILRYCSSECMKKLKEVSPLKLSITKLDNGLGTLKVSIQGSGILSNDEPHAVYSSTVLIYVGTALKEHSEIFPTSLFHSSRSHHLQDFHHCSEVSSLSQVLALVEKSTRDHEYIKCVVSLLLEFFQQHPASNISSSDFYCEMLKQCDMVEAASLSTVDKLYPLLLPLLKIRILDINLISQKSSISEESTRGESNCTQAVVTEYQCLELKEIVPPDCALTIEFTRDIRAIQFSACDSAVDIIFCSVVKQVCLILISRINALFGTIKDDDEPNEDFYNNLIDLYFKVEECFMNMPTMLQQDVCDKAGEAHFFIRKLKKLTNLLYAGLNRGLSPMASKCLLSTLSTVGCLCLKTSKNRFRETILSQTDYIYQLSCQLRELKYIKEIDEFIRSLTIATLNVVGSLCWEFKFYWQIMEAKLPETILSYCDSPLMDVAMAARMTMCPLFCILDSKVMQHMSMNELMMTKMNEVQLSNSKALVPKEFQNIFSLLMYISMLMDRDITASSILSNPKMVSFILRLVSNILQLSEFYQLEMEATVSFIFKLVLTDKFLIVDHEELVGQLLSLTGSSLTSLQVTASCILWKLDDKALTDLPHQYVYECYKRKFYAECLFICEEILKTGGDSLCTNYDEILLIKGKALFCSFKNEFMVLKQQKSHLQEKAFRIRHSDCLAKAKKAIDTLGILFDRGALENDSEGYQFLDLGMIYYAHETNDLRSCKRCLLCRKVAKLHRSHIWPRAILQDFSSEVELPKSKRTLLVSWKSHERYSSPKEVTFFLFCGSCENLLSGHGESQFIPHFFRQVHEVSSGSDEIEYGSWLYEFCIGVIFRGLLQPSILEFINADETYSMFTYCRDFLLNLIVSSSTMNSDPAPDIYIILNQMASDDHPDKHLCSLLNLLAFYGVEEIDLADGSITRPRSAQYFIAHFGMINIITKFRASIYELNPAAKIHLAGGTFTVFENSKRQCLIPPGIWSQFLQLVDFQANENVMSKENLEMLGAVDRDLSSMLLHIKLSSSSPKMISFLPKGFNVLRSDIQSHVELPTRHRILLHYLITLKESEETMFLCIGSDGNYSLCRPYVIYHYFKSGFQLAMGFFISPDDLTAQEFLPESRDLIELNKIESVSVFRQYIHKLLPTILKEKGFCSFRSLLYRIHDHNEGSVDLRCQSLSRCWYCLDRCDFCMEVVPFGCTRASIEFFHAQFCNSCRDISRKKGSLEAKVAPVNPKSSLPIAVSPLSKFHRPLVHARCSATIGRKPFIMEFVLCTDENSDDLPIALPYVVYHYWNFTTQQYLEFTVTSEMSPAEPVVYTEGDDSKMAVTRLREMPIQKILLQAIREYSIVL